MLTKEYRYYNNFDYLLMRGGRRSSVFSPTLFLILLFD